MIYKLNFNRIITTFRIGLNAIILSLGLIICTLLVKFKVIEIGNIHQDRINKGILGCIVGTSFIWLPSFICLVQYIRISKYIELTFSEDTRALVIKTDKQTLDIKENEIISIEMICSLAVAEGRTNLIATDPFYYYKINIINKNYAIIPCIVIGNELKEIYPDKIKITPKIMAFISK